MDRVCSKLTVYFDDPFWVGVFETVADGRLSVSKVTFGAEPKDYEVNEFISKCFYSIRFSPSVDVELKAEKRNPKRIQRDVKKAVQIGGIGTKSQQALKEQQELFKTERKQKSREHRLLEEKEKFEMRQQKKKEKHRGH